MIHERSAIGQAIRDTDDLVDIAYFSLGCVMLATVGTIPVMLGMSIWEFHSCIPLVKPDVVVNCFYKAPGADVALVCGGFSTALLALAGYMAATRTQHNREQTVVAPNATTVTQNQPQAAEAATDVEPTKRRR